MGGVLWRGKGGRYEDTVGRMLEGESRALPSEAVPGFRPGNGAAIKVEPRKPEESLASWSQCERHSFVPTRRSLTRAILC